MRGDDLQFGLGPWRLSPPEWNSEMDSAFIRRHSAKADSPLETQVHQHAKKDAAIAPMATESADVSVSINVPAQAT
jgi:hypothetical protein